MHCKHEFTNKPGMECLLDNGHNGPHLVFITQTPGASMVQQWSDDGEQSKPHIQHGRAFQCDYDKGPKERQTIMNLAIHDANKSLEPDTVFEVRAKLTPELSSGFRDYGRTGGDKQKIAEDWGICWYYVPKVEQPPGFEHLPDESTATDPLFRNDVDDPVLIQEGGYLLLARIAAGG